MIFLTVSSRAKWSVTMAIHHSYGDAKNFTPLNRNYVINYYYRSGVLLRCGTRRNIRRFLSVTRRVTTNWRSTGTAETITTTTTTTTTIITTSTTSATRVLLYYHYYHHWGTAGTRATRWGTQAGTPTDRCSARRTMRTTLVVLRGTVRPVTEAPGGSPAVHSPNSTVTASVRGPKLPLPTSRTVACSSSSSEQQLTDYLQYPDFCWQWASFCHSSALL